MLLDRFLPIFCMTSLKQHMEYFNFRCQIQLVLPVPPGGMVGTFGWHINSCFNRVMIALVMSPPPFQILVVPAQPAGVASLLDEVHHIAAAPPLPLHPHRRPPRHAGRQLTRKVLSQVLA